MLRMEFVPKKKERKGSYFAPQALGWGLLRLLFPAGIRKLQSWPFANEDTQVNQLLRVGDLVCQSTISPASGF